MVKKTKKKSKFKWVTSRPVLITAGSVVGLLGGLTALDNHWLPREVYTISYAQVQQDVRGLQKEMVLQSNRNEVFYWMRRETELRTECSRDPKNVAIRGELEEAIVERRRAEDNVKKLQELK